MDRPRPDRRGPAGRIPHAAARLAVLAHGALRGALAGALTALLLLPASPAGAQDLPALFRVQGVAADDALNVRAAPSASAPVLGTLPPEARGVEVLALSPDGAWARVPRPEGSGWVARRFLAAEAPPLPGLLPRPLVCRGTEPFWSVTLSGPFAMFDSPETGPVPLRPLGEAAGVSGGVAAFDRGGGTVDLTVVRRACSDGMSDRPYGFAALLWDRGPTLLEGCCTLQP